MVTGQPWTQVHDTKAAVSIADQAQVLFCFRQFYFTLNYIWRALLIRMSELSRELAAIYAWMSLLLEDYESR